MTAAQELELSLNTYRNRYGELQKATADLDAKLRTYLVSSTSRDKLLIEAAGLLSDYAEFIRTKVGADDLEMHPYLPEIENVIERAIKDPA